MDRLLPLAPAREGVHEDYGRADASRDSDANAVADGDGDTAPNTGLPVGKAEDPAHVDAHTASGAHAPPHPAATATAAAVGCWAVHARVHVLRVHGTVH